MCAMKKCCGGDDAGDWLVAAACCWIALCSAGISRSFGILYVEIVSVFDASREAASWPLSVFMAVANLTGILPGLLVRRFSVREIVLCGAAICTLGFILCFFATGVLWITLAFGVIAGFGSGLIMAALPITLTQYFEKNRATANGIFLSGCTVATATFPSLSEFFLENFGLRGTFLLLGGIVLNIFTGAALLRPKKYKGKTTQEEDAAVKKEEKYLIPTGRYEDDRQDSSNLLISRVPLEKASSMKKDIYNKVDKSNTLSTPNQENAPTVKICAPSERIQRQSDTENEFLGFLSNGKERGSGNTTSNNTSNKTVHELSKIDAEFEENGDFYKARVNGHQETYKDTAEPDGNIVTNKAALCSNRSTLSLCIDTLRDPMFTIITISAVVTRNVIITYSLVLMDYMMDKGLTKNSGVFLVSVIAVPELVGRLCSGWVSDHRYLERRTVFMTSQILSGAMLLGLTFFSSEPLLFLLSALFALANGSAFILMNVFFREYMGVERMPVALSLKNIFAGMSSLLRPWFIGIFRDRIESYAYMFHILAFISAAAGAIWLLEPTLMKRKSSKGCHHDAL